MGSGETNNPPSHNLIYKKKNKLRIRMSPRGQSSHGFSLRNVSLKGLELYEGSLLK